MDIVKIIRLHQLKASFVNLRLKQKFFLILCLLSFAPIIMPHETFAAAQNAQIDNGPVLIFNLSDPTVDDYLEMRSQELSDQYYQSQLRLQAQRLQKLTKEVQDYLNNHSSPLAPYASTLVTLRNWKKIVALANAESTMCRHYPTDKSNCWGVGGSNLWDMGSNLGEGIISMNHFLNKYPLGSPVKYSLMSFERMNGLYKQPPADHWLNNNQVVYSELADIENSVQ